MAANVSYYTAEIIAAQNDVCVRVLRLRIYTYTECHVVAESREQFPIFFARRPL